jgi:hypothetical protein
MKTQIALDISDELSFFVLTARTATDAATLELGMNRSIIPFPKPRITFAAANLILDRHRRSHLPASLDDWLSSEAALNIGWRTDERPTPVLEL